jgi:hypothetical protein
VRTWPLEAHGEGQELLDRQVIEHAIFLVGFSYVDAVLAFKDATHNKSSSAKAHFFVNHGTEDIMQLGVLIQEYPVAGAEIKFGVVIIKRPYAVQDGEHAKDSVIGREAHYAPNAAGFSRLGFNAGSLVW